MRAFIMAAGVGSRLAALSQQRPKCLLEIGGQTLLSRMLDLFESRGITDVTVVTGHRADLVRHEVGDRARTVHNASYLSTNSIASLDCARDLLEGDVLVTNGDLFYEEALLDRLLADPRDRVLVSDTSRIEDADYRFTLDGDRIVGYGKNIPVERTDAEYVGLAKIGATFVPAFRQRLTSMVSAGQCHHWWEDALYSMIPEGVPIYAHDVAGIFWGEVDYVKDYERLQRWVRVQEAA
jgi:L-glutamine-phosphate cytidylyltransferase